LPLLLCVRAHDVLADGLVGITERAEHQGVTVTTGHHAVNRNGMDTGHFAVVVCSWCCPSRDAVGVLDLAAWQRTHRYAAFPAAYPVDYRDARCFLIERFPYCLHYRLENDTVVVVSCLHGGARSRVETPSLARLTRVGDVCCGIHRTAFRYRCTLGQPHGPA
jgi:hypothetical protein